GWVGRGGGGGENAPSRAGAPWEAVGVALYHTSRGEGEKSRDGLFATACSSRHGVPFVKARFQNVYGPGEILGAGRWRGTPHTVWRNVVPTFVWKSLQRAALPVENGGVPTRDFIFFEDILDGLITLAQSRRPRLVYNPP